MHKQYLKASLLFFTVMMLCIALVNVFVDPGEIYFKKIISEKKSKELALKILGSENGVIKTGWSERLVKASLAEVSGDTNCVVLGSSRIMQISSIRDTGGIKSKCENLINLGVSGAGIEDISIFSYLVLNNIKHPKHVFISVDPWTFKFGMDSRYGAHDDLYMKMNALLGGKPSRQENAEYSQKVLSNLFNGTYLYQSIKLFMKGDVTRSSFMKEIEYPNTAFSYSDGYIEPVTLADGSHIYAKSWIDAQKNKPVEPGGGSYKINGSPYDQFAVTYFKKIIKLYKKNNIKVELVMVPYHPNVFKVKQSPSVKVIQLMEGFIKEFSAENSLKYYGSFTPSRLGCNGAEFYDFMHPTIECLNKINFGT